MTKINKLPSLEFIRERLAYDPDTGLFLRLKGKGKGKIAGCVSVRGRLVIKLGKDRDKKGYQASRIAWKITTGKDPDNQIDHINGNKLDNRFCNLREATNSENQCNTFKRASCRPYKGVFQRIKPNGDNYDDWTYQIKRDYKLYQTGGFKTALEAHEARCALGKQLHGDYFSAKVG
jgi:hypothetical protein